MLPPLAGHHVTRKLLGSAGLQNTLPQSILLSGPRGVGKERLGLWLAQLLVCESPTDEPCQACKPCRLVTRLEHPDVHWFFPMPRPESTSADKLRDRLEEQRGAELQKWRENPFHIPDFEKAPAHFLASIRSLQQLSTMRPALGRRKIFVVGDAELMVPQESSPEAANAFLKLLEEPPRETTLILTSSQPGALLPTILSRVLSVRVGLVDESAIATLLEAGGLATADSAAAIAVRARGSVRRAVQLATGGGDGADEERKVGREMLVAALSDGPVARLALAHDRRPTGARVELVDDLQSLAGWLRDLLAVTTGADQQVSDPASLPILRRMVEKRRVGPGGIMKAIDRVTAAGDLALINVNPQLIVTSLLADIQADLTPAGGA